MRIKLHNGIVVSIITEVDTSLLVQMVDAFNANIFTEEKPLEIAIINFEGEIDYSTMRMLGIVDEQKTIKKLSISEFLDTLKAINDMEGWEMKRKKNILFHFFAANFSGWKTGENLQTLMNEMKKDGVLYNLYYVPLPADSPYSIKYYKPDVAGIIFLGQYGG